MHRKSLVPTIVGLSLAVFVTDVSAQRGGRGGGEPRAEGGQAPAAGRGPRGGGQAGGRLGGRQAVNPLFAALDANGDGVVTTAEMQDAVQILTKLDENKDGELTAQEAGSSSQSPAAVRGGRGGRGGASEGAPAVGPGRGRGRQGAEGGAGRGSRGTAQPGRPPASEGNSKSPFED